MSTRLPYLVGLASALLTACAAPTPIATPRPLGISPDPAEYAPYLKSGPLELSGQAFLTTRGGDVKLAAGRMVTLDPATKYAREWFRRWGADRSRFDTPAPESLFVAARHTTTANAEGRFRFADLPPGEYIVRTLVTWETGAAYSGVQGGVVASLVSLPAEAKRELILSQVFTPDLAATLGVAIVDDPQLAMHRYRVLSHVNGVSCQVGLLDAGPTVDKARENLIINAASKAADGVAHVVCNKHGMSLRPNCTSRIECEGDAISWT
jgi:hypothetical protein